MSGQLTDLRARFATFTERAHTRDRPASFTSLRERIRSSLDVPAKATGIFKDYAVDLYFPANRMTRLERIRCAPVLLLIEYLVYKVDSITEGAKSIDLDVARNDDYGALHRYKRKFEKLLRRAHAYNSTVACQIECGEQYVRLENRVTSHRSAGHAEVMRLAELRPSDVRLLHGMIFALLNRTADDALVEALWPVEVLADIGNDLAHYERDVATGQFNTYAMFVNLYGRHAPERLRAEIAGYEKSFHSALERVPPHRRAELLSLCERRYRGSTSVIPEPIPQPAYLSPTHTHEADR